jgi:GNAT superfamily N-acetyltransferase
VTTALRVEPLGAHHDLRTFDSGAEPLDAYLRRFAGQNARRGIGRTYVAVREDDPRVLGYFTLSAGSVATDVLPDDVARRLPRYPVPVVHLGRLAVDRAMQGQGLGAALLVEALRRAVRVAAEIAVFAVEVVAKDAAARRFYAHHGFAPMRDDPHHLYLPIETARRLFEAASG